MEENNTKEINLLQLINLLFKWIKKIVKSIINFIGFLAQMGFRHKIIVITTVLLCFVLGLYFSRPSARIYKAEAMAMLYGVETQTAKEICKQLENSVSSNKYYSLSAKLSIPDSVSRNIVEIRSFYVIANYKDKVGDKIDYKNDHPSTDTLNLRLRDRFYLQIKTKNISQVPKVQAAILNFFNSDPVMKSQFEAKKNQIIQQIKICDYESQRIDSLAKVSYFKDTDKQLRFEKDKLLIGEQKKQLFYEDLLKLQDIKADAQVKLTDFKQPMVLPSGFYVSSAPENGSMKYGILGIIYGLIVSLILAGLKENFSKITTFLENK